MKGTKGGQLLVNFVIFSTEEFPDYKTVKEREQFLKSGQGSKWLDEFESGTRPA